MTAACQTASMTSENPQYMVDYYANGEHIHQDEHALTPPVIGHGIELAGTWYRIVDVWTVTSKRAPVTHGTAAFLRKVEIPEVFHEVDGRYYR